MTLTFAMLAGMMALQSSAHIADLQDTPNQVQNVAYDALASGDTDRAVAELEAKLRDQPEDPATLINLGAAYEMRGDLLNAQRAYRAAMDSSVRYRLELAGGEWQDSRYVARRALTSLEYRTLASR